MKYVSLKNAVMDRVMAPDELKIQLTETEEKICVLLDKCKEYLQAEKGISTTCRIAGGWVRDKVIPNNYSCNIVRTKCLAAFRLSK